MTQYQTNTTCESRNDATSSVYTSTRNTASTLDTTVFSEDAPCLLVADTAARCPAGNQKSIVLTRLFIRTPWFVRRILSYDTPKGLPGTRISLPDHDKSVFDVKWTRDALEALKLHGNHSPCLRQYYINAIEMSDERAQGKLFECEGPRVTAYYVFQYFGIEKSSCPLHNYSYSDLFFFK